MTIDSFLLILEEWVSHLEVYDEKISPLDCCDNRELETVQEILFLARQLKDQPC